MFDEKLSKVSYVIQTNHLIRFSNSLATPNFSFKKVECLNRPETL